VRTSVTCARPVRPPVRANEAAGTDSFIYRSLLCGAARRGGIATSVLLRGSMNDCTSYPSGKRDGTARNCATSSSANSRGGCSSRPGTSACARPEPVLLNVAKYGAGDGNRTHVSSLGSCSSTIELHPPGPSTLIGLRAVRQLPGRRSDEPQGARRHPACRRAAGSWRQTTLLAHARVCRRSARGRGAHKTRALSGGTTSQADSFSRVLRRRLNLPAAGLQGVAVSGFAPFPRYTVLQCRCS
jgi:hypothetical protein